MGWTLVLDNPVSQKLEGVKSWRQGEDSGTGTSARTEPTGRSLCGHCPKGSPVNELALTAALSAYFMSSFSSSIRNGVVNDTESSLNAVV